MVQLQPGQRVEVTQQIPHRKGFWSTSFVGEVLQVNQRKTGSWYAHSEGDRLWLDRLTLRKDDGELVNCIMDQYTRVEILREPSEEASSVPPIDPPEQDGIVSEESDASDEAEAA